MPDRAVPLGLVLNELVTNCIKYAVKDRTDAFIKAQFRADIGTTKALLRIQDNGLGTGEPRQGSTGLRLSAPWHLSSASGACVTMIFPLVE
ncbi:hypothetical protein DC522_06905 [Microvirga sp. KLBC 81]|uniref:sensor histidine kinase n=1 Tax=Microvirga sp. KLBC 81 TaxID=1862707 RepID=UPI000D51DA9D|nr:sensor histidine kinase [Microvirga sp. KLBC 81]PVE25251.1 hypothetical protein DC522_06905 [Microvirga sp. KLBC 81]